MTDNSGQELDNKTLFMMLQKMWRIRLFEEAIEELYQVGEIYGTMHLCIGQEATAVGSIHQLKKTDLIVSTHRNHGHSLAKGTSPRAMFAELLGRITGTNRGKGGSMHIADPAVGDLMSNGIVGGGFPIASGAALTAQMTGTEQVVICYSGDGSTNEGSFHEALNLASIWQLPVIFFIENNQYGMSSAINKMINIEQLSTRSTSYGIPGLTIDGNDLQAVSQATEKAVKRARDGQGPTLIEALTYRFRGHSKSDQRIYRSAAEEHQWESEHDPIKRVEHHLLTQGALSESDLLELIAEIKQEYARLIEEVKKEPRPSLEELHRHVYAD